jgi:hypothetical protein
MRKVAIRPASVASPTEVTFTGYRGQRTPCFVCGGRAEKFELHGQFGDEAMCPRCIEAGEDAIQARLNAHADEVEAWARRLREAASWTWSVPSYGAFVAAVEAHLRDDLGGDLQ